MIHLPAPYPYRYWLNNSAQNHLRMPEMNFIIKFVLHWRPIISLQLCLATDRNLPIVVHLISHLSDKMSLVNHRKHDSVFGTIYGDVSNISSKNFSLISTKLIFVQ